MKEDNYLLMRLGIIPYDRDYDDEEIDEDEEDPIEEEIEGRSRVTDEYETQYEGEFHLEEEPDNVNQNIVNEMNRVVRRRRSGARWTISSDSFWTNEDDDIPF